MPGLGRRASVSQSAFGQRRLEFVSGGKRLYTTPAADESDLWVMELRKR